MTNPFKKFWDWLPPRIDIEKIEKEAARPPEEKGEKKKFNNLAAWAFGISIFSNGATRMLDGVEEGVISDIGYVLAVLGVFLLGIVAVVMAIIAITQDEKYGPRGVWLAWLALIQSGMRVLFMIGGALSEIV